MRSNRGNKADRNTVIVSAKKDESENIEIRMPLDAGSTQSNPDIDEETNRSQQARLAEDFIEDLRKTDIPIRLMTLDDPERCPVQMITGMIKAEPCALSQDEDQREHDMDHVLAGSNDGHGDDGLSDPGRAESYRISGYDKIADGDFQGAFEDLMEAIHLDPQNYRCYGLRGVTHYELGRYAEAIADECKAINMNPTPDTLYNRSEAYYKTGKDEEALRDLEYALELAHEISSNHYLIPEIHKLIGIIKDKTVSGEDYYQAPIGWEKKKGSKGLDSQFETADDVVPAQEVKSVSINQGEQLPFFKGYPYLAISIVSSLVHINLLSAEQNNLEWLCSLAQAQTDANKFEVCLVLDDYLGVYFSSTRKPHFSEQIPMGGIFMTNRLRLSVDQPPGEDLLRRERGLDSLIESTSLKSGFLLGDLRKGGREATQEELVSLHGIQENGLPKGLVICPFCGDYRGECIDPSPIMKGLVVRVSCYCENDNLCAYCGGKLYQRKLNANYYNTEDGGIWHVPSFGGLSHRCPEVPNNI